jgi:hypothetical protein
VKFTVAAILLVALGLGVAVACSGHAAWGDLVILGVAMLAVCVFGAAPVILANRRKQQAPTQTRVVPPLPPSTPPLPPPLRPSRP